MNTEPSTAWERLTHPRNVMRITFVALDARSIYSSADLTSPKTGVAFYATAFAAARAAAVARTDSRDETITQQLNAAIASIGRPSIVQRSLLNGCLDHALKIDSTKRRT